MAQEDVSSALQALQNLSRFPYLSERLHQGILEMMLLARGMRERLGELLDEHEATSEFGIVVDPEQLFYSGISQGGIYGATLMALTPDIEHGHLGVPGNNYSTLLQRSIDFDFYFMFMRMNYLSPVEHVLGIHTVQLLWDRVDPVSYLRHITATPFPGSDPKYVVLTPAKGDYQVATVTNEIAARSDIGIEVMASYGQPLWGIEERAYPHTGSGIVLYDHGNPWAEPDRNVPPSDEFGDPHGKPRRLDEHNEQMVHFFRTGEIIDVCGETGCIFSP